MSTSGVGSSTSFFGGTLTSGSSNAINNPLGAQQSVVGLNSGLNTTAIINEMLAIDEVPLNQLTLRQDGVNAQQQQLTSIQTSLQNVMNDAAALGSPTLFASSQAVTTSDPSAITATTSTGAAVGAYEVSVTPAGELGAAHLQLHEPDLGRHGHDRRRQREHQRRAVGQVVRRPDQLRFQRHRVRRRARQRHDRLLRPGDRQQRQRASSRSATRRARSSSRPASPCRAATPSSPSTAAPPRRHTATP